LLINMQRFTHGIPIKRFFFAYDEN